MPKKYMDMAQVAPGDGYVVDSSGAASISKKSVKRVGGVERMTQRLVGIYQEMPISYRLLGPSWYPDANRFASELAQTYDYTVWQVAQVVGVLSPQNPWNGAFDSKGNQWADGNKICTTKVVRTFYEHGPEEVHKLKGWGYHHPFMAKAIRVLQGEELDWSKALKTHRFSLLVANPKLLRVACCDTHASRIATGNLGNRYHNIQNAAYLPIEEAYIIASDILGIPAQELQAALWQYAVDGLLW